VISALAPRHEVRTTAAEADVLVERARDVEAIVRVLSLPGVGRAAGPPNALDPIIIAGCDRPPAPLARGDRRPAGDFVPDGRDQAAG